MASRYEEIDAFRISHDDLPDGAFFALAEEQGIAAEDWAEWVEEYVKRAASTRAAGEAGGRRGVRGEMPMTTPREQLEALREACAKITEMGWKDGASCIRAIPLEPFLAKAESDSLVKCARSPASGLSADALVSAVSEAFQRREPSSGKWLAQFDVAREAIRKFLASR